MHLVETVAIVGATPRGLLIARAALLAGYKTILEDFSSRTLEEAHAFLTASLADDASGRFKLTTSIEEALREADLVIEASAEEMETKIELFTIFDKFAKPDAILASSSPSLPIEDMASVTFCPERCIGIRLPDRDAASRESSAVIELVRTPQTLPAVVDACREFTRRMGKQAIVVQQSDAARAAKSD